MTYFIRLAVLNFNDLFVNVLAVSLGSKLPALGVT